MDFKITILGNGAATPTLERNQCSQVLSVPNQNYLIDCGESTQLQLLKYKINQNKIRNIFISHLHPDHYIGLIGLITSQNLKHREESLRVFAPPGLQEIIQIQLKHSDTALRFPLIFHHLISDAPQWILNEGPVDVQAFPLKHRLPCFGFLFKEKPGERKIHKTLIDGKDLPFEALQTMKKGQDYTDQNGITYKYRQYTFPPPPPRTYAYVSDTQFSPGIVPAIKKANILYHEATFEASLKEKAERTFHSTTQDAATIARKARAGKLLIGHFSSRYQNPEPLLHEAREIFSQTYLAKEGTTFEIKYVREAGKQSEKKRRIPGKGT